jgi:hypothetical protein
MKRITVFMMMAMMTVQLKAASESKEDRQITSRVVTRVPIAIDSQASAGKRKRESSHPSDALSPQEQANIAELFRLSSNMTGDRSVEDSLARAQAALLSIHDDILAFESRHGHAGVAARLPTFGGLPSSNRTSGSGHPPAGGASGIVASSTPLEKFSDPALKNLGAFLDPKDAVALNQTSKAFSSVTQEHMANYVIDAIVSGGTPHACAIEQLRKLKDGVRQGLLKASLQAKFGDRPFKIRNDLFAADMAKICGRVDQTDPVVEDILRTNPIIGQHVQNCYLVGTPEETTARRAAIVASIQTNYRTLSIALTDHRSALDEGRNDYVGPTYVTATIVELTTNMAAANAYFTAHPNVTLVLMAPEGNALTLGQGNIPQSLRSLSIVGDHVTKIGNGFLYDCKALTTLNLDLRNVSEIGSSLLYGCNRLTTLNLDLRNVTNIGYEFLAGCNRLTTLNLDLRNVSEIGSRLLYGCKGLTTLDLSPLRNVTKIGDGFLHGCKGLTTLDLRPLGNVTNIGDNFLQDCQGLITLYLRPLRNVTKIGDGFLHGCEGLTALDLRPLGNVTKIGDGFLYGCNRLTTLKLDLRNVTKIGDGFLSAWEDGDGSLSTSEDGDGSLSTSEDGDGSLSEELDTLNLDLRNVTEIGDKFLHDCKKLTTLTLDLRNVTTIGNKFLDGCKKLTTLNLDLRSFTEIGDCFLSAWEDGDRVLFSFEALTTLNLDLRNVTNIGDGFLSGCKGLTTLNLDLRNVTEIGGGFLGHCSKLSTLKLDLRKVTEIGGRFLDHCSKLTTLNLDLRSFTEIGDGFLHGCKKLTTLNLDLSNVSKIGDDFLSLCEGLTTLDLSSLSSLTQIGSYFLTCCKGLTTINLSSLRNVTEIGSGFLYKCDRLDAETQAVVEKFKADVDAHAAAAAGR